MKILTYSPAWTKSKWFVKVEQISKDVDVYLFILACAAIFLAAMFQK